MTSAKLLSILRDFVPEYHHAKFCGNWTTNKRKQRGHNVPPTYILPKYPNLNPSGTKGFGTHTKHQGGQRGPAVSQERQMLQT